jgi:3-hydroxyisobutyrate dehydrogenase-like beta-hydroxyacid dehydrogenase
MMHNRTVHRSSRTTPELAGRKVAVFGLGEAGAAIAADLVRVGADVAGFDPADVRTPDGVRRVGEPTEAVARADLVLAVTPAADAPAALKQGLDAIAPSVVYADLSTASPDLKRQLAGAAPATMRFVDVALMSPVAGKGLFTPQLASGPGAVRYAGLLAEVGVPVEVAGSEAGDAATRKLLRSVAVKGFAAAVIEAVRAAEAAGLLDETWHNLVQQFTAIDEAFLRRMIDGTATHALRRLHEMEAAGEMLEHLGVDPVVTRATVESLRRVPSEGVTTLPGA